MNQNLKAELERLVRRANGNYDYRFLDALDTITETPAYGTHPDEVAELLDDIVPGLGTVYKEWP